MADLTFSSSHSTTVRLWLDCGVHGNVPVARTIGNAVLVQASAGVPACDATLVVEIDAQPHCFPMQILSGFEAGTHEAILLARGHVAPF